MPGAWVRVPIGKKLEEKLKAIATEPYPPGKFSAGVARQLLAKIEDTREQKKSAAGLSPKAAVNLVRGVLGSAALLPLDSGWGPLLSLVKRRINFLGLTADDVERAARRAQRTLRLPTSVSYIFTIMDTLLERTPPQLGLLGETEEQREQRVITGRDEE